MRALEEQTGSCIVPGLKKYIIIREQKSENSSRLWLSEIPCWKCFPANCDAAGSSCPISGCTRCYPCQGLGIFRQGKWLLENRPRLRERSWIFSSESATAFLIFFFSEKNQPEVFQTEALSWTSARHPTNLLRLVFALNCFFLF